MIEVKQYVELTTEEGGYIAKLNEEQTVVQIFGAEEGNPVAAIFDTAAFSAFTELVEADEFARVIEDILEVVEDEDEDEDEA